MYQSVRYSQSPLYSYLGTVLQDYFMSLIGSQYNVIL